MLIPFTRTDIAISWDNNTFNNTEKYSQKVVNLLWQWSSSDLQWSTLKPQFIWESDLYRIYQIEQDAWAHGIEEYLKCDNCKTIVWKEAMYGALPNKVRKRTVSEIEKILWKPDFICNHCTSTMLPIYGISYMWEINERYTTSHWYLSVLRDMNGTIQGFIDWYVDDFSTIYTREFSQYYSNCLDESDLRWVIESKLWKSFPDKIFFWTSIALSEEYKSLKYIYDLLKLFFCSMSLDENTLCISEARVGTNISKIYLKMWAQALEISSCIDPKLLHWKWTNVQNDIYLQENIVSSYQDNLTLAPRDFWRFCFR